MTSGVARPIASIPIDRVQGPEVVGPTPYLGYHHPSECST